MKIKQLLFSAALIAGWFGGMLLSPAGLRAADEPRLVNFTVFLRNSQVLRMGSDASRLDLERSAFDIVVYEKDGDTFREVRRIGWPEIARSVYSIDLINFNRSAYSKSKLLLTRQDDTQSVIDYASLYYTDGGLLDKIFYSEFNEVSSRWVRTSISIAQVKKLIFGSMRLMINTKTGILYPPDYRYDPHTGEALVQSALKED